MSQIAGYALGGCWTHIGCAQSVVAFAFIQRDVDEHYTPVQWIKEMTPVIIKILVLLAVLIYARRRALDMAVGANPVGRGLSMWQSVEPMAGPHESPVNGSFSGILPDGSGRRGAARRLCVRRARRRQFCVG